MLVAPEDLIAWTLTANRVWMRGETYAADWPADAPSNCLFWALQQEAAHGGAVMLTQSEYGPWRHGRWQRKDGRIFEFTPDAAKYPQTSPPTLFEGTVQEWVAR